MPSQLTTVLRESLHARLAASNNTVRAVATASGVDYKNLLAFSHGGLPNFGIDELERLIAYLRLRLTPEPPAPEPQKAAARRPVH